MLSNTIVFDVETTGLDATVDDILQISIIDGNGNTMLDTLVKPILKTEWSEAMAINGITPEMVSDAPTPEELIPKVKEIFEKADTWISYNGTFDLRFLKAWGINLTTQKHIDVMLRFADYYKEPNEKYPGQYRWKKLVYAAEHFGFKWEERAHNSLGDVKATLYVNEVLDRISFEKPLFWIDGENLICMNYNSKSESAQFEETTLSLDKLYAIRNYDEPNEYFDAILKYGTQVTYTRDTQEFDAAALKVAGKAEYVGRSADTMDQLKQVAAKYMEKDDGCLTMQKR